MYIQKRTSKDGSYYYSFSYIKNGKRVRLKKSEHPHFTEFEEAEAWAKSQAAFQETQKAHIERRLAWQKKYYDFNLLLQKYTEWQKLNAPNSYKHNIYNLTQYIFDFFLNQKKASNVNNWHLIQRDFVDWLMAYDPPLAVNSINNIIRTLNTFVNCLLEYGLISPDFAPKVKALPDHMANERTIDDVIKPEEYQKIGSELEKINPDSADFFRVLYNTGMRFSELHGLPMNALFRGETDGALHSELAKCGISYVGYIYLDSQLAEKGQKRNPDGSFNRKPLKSRKKISPKNARVIPIRDTQIWNILAKRWKEQKALLDKGINGQNQRDYLLFDNLSMTRTKADLKKAFTNLHLKFRSYHCCRHSYVTWLVGETRNFFLVRTITGHKKDQVFEKYIHLWEQIALEAAAKEQIIDILE